MTRSICALFAILLFSFIGLSGQSFEEYFADSTLRIDYAFSGDTKEIRVYPEELVLLSGWYGRRSHLDSLALEGNGEISVRDKASGRVIYRTSFSSLFQEWLSTEEAGRVRRSYENVYLVPFPKREAIIDIRLRNVHREQIAHYSFEVDPKDILIRSKVGHPATPHEYLHKGGDPKECIDLVVLAEGYTEAEMDKFLKHAKQATEAIFSHEPFKRYKDRFNVIAVKSASSDSGVSVPREGKWLNTAFGSHFDTFYSDRYMTTRRIKQVHESIANIPYEHILILVNTETYGGGGIYNSYTIASALNKHFEPVVVHEFGHSFGGLADEYFYDEDTMTDTYSATVEPWEMNVTNLKDFEGKKWSNLIGKKVPIPTPMAQKDKVKVGLYEGAAYSKRGFYRASYDCRMRTNSNPIFCPACHQALEGLIRYYLDKETE